MDNRTPLQRLLAFVDHTSGDCWPWQGALGSNGYGRFTLRGVAMTAHRAAYLLLVGTIPAGMQIDHLCRNRSCVRPDHLEPVTPRENLLRAPASQAARKSAQTTCVRGHELVQSPVGRRRCRSCSREASRRYRIAHPKARRPRDNVAIARKGWAALTPKARRERIERAAQASRRARGLTPDEYRPAVMT